MMNKSNTNAQHHGCAFRGWQCFHCGEIFETVEGAQLHFGADQTKEPGCLIRVNQSEQGLLTELRNVEAARDALQYQISKESTAADVRIQSLQGQHQIELRREEEKGYARGLADGHSLALRLFLVTGRELGDDDDTAHVVEATNMGEAESTFINHLCAEGSSNEQQIVVTGITALQNAIANRLITVMTSKNENTH